jgi:hypothetical protein
LKQLDYAFSTVRRPTQERLFIAAIVALSRASHPEGQFRACSWVASAAYPWVRPVIFVVLRDLRMRQDRISPQPDENFLPVSQHDDLHHSKKVEDRRRINLHQPYELGYWSRKFGVSEQELSRAVQKVGTNAEDVAIELGK